MEINKIKLRKPNEKKHICPKCNKINAIFDIVSRKYYCLSCNNEFEKNKN